MVSAPAWVVRLSAPVVAASLLAVRAPALVKASPVPPVKFCSVPTALASVRLVEPADDPVRVVAVMIPPV